MSDVSVERRDAGAVVELRRPPHNFFDHGLVADLAGAFEDLERDVSCRAAVLASEGKSFCADAGEDGDWGRFRVGRQQRPVLLRETTLMVSVSSDSAHE